MSINKKSIINIDTSIYKGIWVFIEYNKVKIQSVSLELLSVGRKLADKQEEELTAIILGNNLDHVVKEVSTYGADKVMIIENEFLNEFTLEGYVKTLYELSQKYKPSILLIGSTLNGRELAPRLAARLYTGITADCVGFDIDENGSLIQIKPFGPLVAEILCCTRPQIATVKPNVFKKLKKEDYRNTSIIREKILIDSTDINLKIINHIKTTNNPHDRIEDAEKIIAVGRGIGSKENLDLIYDLALVFGAKVAGSKPLVNKGWLNKNQEIGQSGVTVNPKLYIAIGISGSMYHTVGMKNSDIIIAINKDPNAPIFQISTYGIIGDLFKIIPIVKEKLKKVLNFKENENQLILNKNEKIFVNTPIAEKR